MAEPAQKVLEKKKPEERPRWEVIRKDGKVRSIIKMDGEEKAEGMGLLLNRVGAEDRQEAEKILEGSTISFKKGKGLEHRKFKGIMDNGNLLVEKEKKFFGGSTSEIRPEDVEKIRGANGSIIYDSDKSYLLQLGKAEEYIEKGDYAKAREIYLEQLKKHPEEGETHNKVASCYINERNINGAVEHMGKAFTLAENEEELKKYRGNAYRIYRKGIRIAYETANQGKYSKAIDMFNMLIEFKQKPPGKGVKDSTIFYNLALCHYKLGENGEAKLYAQKALETESQREKSEESMEKREIYKDFLKGLE